MSNFESSEPNLPSLRSRAREILGNSYESCKSLIADIPLKVQEMLGKISEKDFDKLIEADIKRTFAFSPPIPGKFPFHSREYTKQVSRQVEGMAYYRLIAERIIERNPNVPAEKLSKYLKLFAEKYNLPEEKLTEFEWVIRNFDNSRKEVKRVRDLYPNDKDLVSSLFYDVSDFDDNVKVATTPYCIVIYTTPENISKLSGPNTAGFFRVVDTSTELNTYHMAPVVVVPFVKNSETKKVYTHEIQHAKNQVFFTDRPFQIPLNYYDEVISISSVKLGEIMNNYSKRTAKLENDLNLCRNKISDLNQLIETESDSVKLQDLKNEKSKIIKELEFLELTLKNLNGSKYEDSKRFKKIISLKAQSYFYESLNSSKDELLAMLKDGKSSYFDYLGKNNSYEYRMTEVENLIQELEENNLTDFANQVRYWQKKYFELVTKSIDSFNMLLELGGYSRDEAVAVLSSIPILLWSRTAKRLIAAKLS